MSFAAMLCLVLVAAYGLASLLLSMLVAVGWRVGLDRACSTSADYLVLRLLPAAGAALLVLTVVLPAFLIYEPGHELEAVGPVPLALVLVTLITAGAGLVRGVRACTAARAFLRNCPRATHSSPVDGQAVDLIDIREPLVAVVGGWRPRFVAARQVFDACSQEEFRQVIAHEAAHVSTRDNLKVLLLVVSPDVLAWLSAGSALVARWRVMAEFEADDRATGADPRKRVALASALIKVARLSSGAVHPLPALSMPVAREDVEGRVRRLLSPSPATARTTTIKSLVICASLLPVAAVPLYGLVHQFVEALVAFGR